MENEIETLDSLNEEGAEPEISDTTENVVALKEKYDELAAKNRQLFERAKRAEGFEQNKEGKWIKKSEPKAETPPQSSEPDYAKLAYLETKGINHPDDQKVVMDEANRLKLPLTDILQMKHIKSQLDEAKDQREAASGIPKGKGGFGSRSQQEVDYWLQKGETPDDLELAAKVIEARIHKEKIGNKFSDDLYTG